MRLGNPHHPAPQRPTFGRGYRRDRIARHLWLDLWFWRLAVIVTLPARAAVAS